MHNKPQGRLADVTGKDVSISSAAHYEWAGSYDRVNGFMAEIERLEKTGVCVLQSIEDHNTMDALEQPGKLIIARAGNRG